MPSDAVLKVNTALRLGSRSLRLDWETSARSLAVLGPTGIGKTGLLRLLAGLEKKASGRIEFQQTVWQDSAQNIFVPPWERQVGWVPQESLLFPHLDVTANLAFSSPSHKEVGAIADLLSME